MAKSLEGIIGALLTPFNSSGTVDYCALKAEIDFTIDVCRADAVSIGAVEASEYRFLSLEERKELIRQGTEMVRGRVPVIAGVSHHSVETAAALSRFAADGGADFVQALAQNLPWGGSPQSAEVLRYFQLLGDRTPLPIVAYLFAGPGADVSIQSTIALSKSHPKICGFKESSRDLKRIGRLIEEIDRPGHAGYFTTMEMLLITLELGGSGATMPPPAVRIAKNILTAYRGGRLQDAIAGQRVFSLLSSRFGTRGLPPLMKASLKILGIDIGDPHSPYEPFSMSERNELLFFFQEHGLLLRD